MLRVHLATAPGVVVSDAIEVGREVLVMSAWWTAMPTNLETWKPHRMFLHEIVPEVAVAV
jgi:hypothetical protein